MGLEIKPCCQYVGTLTLHGVICGYRYRNEPFPNYGVLHSFAFMFDVGVITTLCHSRCKKSYSVHPLHTSHHHESSFERFFSVLVLFSCRVVSGAFGWRCRHQTVAPKERHAFFSKYVAPLTDVFAFVRFLVTCIFPSYVGTCRNATTSGIRLTATITIFQLASSHPSLQAICFLLHIISILSYW